MGNALNVPDWAQQALQTFGFVDHMEQYVSGDRWTAVLTDLGTAAVGDEKGGVLTLTASDGTVADNDEAYLGTTNEIFKFTADKPIYGAFRIQYSEANTDDANVAVGFKDAVAANSLQDDGAGPPSSYSGAILFKADGDTVWSFETSVGTTQTTTQSTTTAGGSSYQELEIFVIQHNSTKLEAYPKVDGQQLKDANGNWIKHEITIGSATEMDAFVGVKNGGANNESVKIDTVIALQKV